MKYNSVKKHLEDDIKMFKREMQEDKDLMKKISKPKRSRKMSKKSMIKRGEKIERKRLLPRIKKEDKISEVMHEFKEGKLRSGSKRGPQVKSRKQAIAIALSEARRFKKKRK